MKTKKIIFIILGGFALMAIMAVIAVVLFVVHVSKRVEDVAVNVSSPADVMVGQTFDLEVKVTNERAKKTLQLSDIDIAEGYLAGFTVASIKPAPKSNMHVPLDNSRSFNFDTTVAAGTNRSFIFTLRAEKAGIYRGDVDVCEGMQFVTAMAQTVVKEEH